MDSTAGIRPLLTGLIVLVLSSSATEALAQEPTQPPPNDQPAAPALDQPAVPAPQVPQAIPGLGTPTIKAPDPRDDMDLAFDLGAGLFEFIHIDITWLISRQWSVGLGVGFFPIDWALRKVMGVDDLSAGAAAAGLLLTGEVQTTLGSGRIFGRWYPWKKTFFTELSVEMWRLIVKAEGSLTSISEELIEVKTTAKVWVPMVGLHGGWRIMWKNGAYLDLAGGLNVFLSPGAEVTLGGATLDQVAEYPEGAAALDTAQEFLTEKLKDGANSITKKIKVFPTGAIRFGWAFDFW